MHKKGIKLKDRKETGRAGFSQQKGAISSRMVIEKVKVLA